MKWDREGMRKNTHTATPLSDIPTTKRQEYKTGKTTVFKTLSREQVRLVWLCQAVPGDRANVVFPSMGLIKKKKRRVSCLQYCARK